MGFVCARSLFWLRKRESPTVELAGAAPVLQDRHAPRQPVYFSEVIVHRESPIGSFPELRGGSWAYNDPCSLSSYHDLLKKLAEMGEDEGFHGRISRSGSYLISPEMVTGGEADAAAIDSNVLRIALQTAPELRERLRVLESRGPFPIQPVSVGRATTTRRRGPSGTRRAPSPAMRTPSRFGVRTAAHMGTLAQAQSFEEEEYLQRVRGTATTPSPTVRP